MPGLVLSLLFDHHFTLSTFPIYKSPVLSRSKYNPTSLFVLCSHKFTGNEPEKPTMIRSTGTYWEYEINIDERDLFNLDLLGITISETKHKQGPHQGDNTISGQTFSFPVVNSEDFDFSEEERVTRNFLLESVLPSPFIHNNRHFDEWSALLQVTGFKEELEEETSIDSWALTLTARHTTVPEPSSIFGILAVGTLGAASTLKRKLKPSKSTGRSPV